jgi:glucuronosyltransferase
MYQVLPTFQTMWIATIACLLAATSAHLAIAANILAILPTPSPSHHLWNSVLMTTLAARGHHVTVISPDPEKVPVVNHTDIVLEGTYEFIESNWDYTTMDADGPFKSMMTTWDWGTGMCDHWMNSEGVRTLFESKEKYDLIIIEVVTYECFLGFVRHFGNPPLIGVTAFAHPLWASKSTGDVETPSYIPNLYLTYSDHMNFMERFTNAMLYAFVTVYRNLVYLPKIDEIARRRFGVDLPPVSEIEANISLVMVNSHFSFDYPRPLLPAMVPVGGLHIRPPKPLAKVSDVMYPGASCPEV